ncbi:heavy-metal-associated domain-containing protein [Streptomyces sp. ISL-11]|uniref:heavy-metal-associated domain-containing protein n=1 Tax=Streptomyces sp. ISL-11 TaxID=2819174 RepID=UPI001BE593D4|nr:cation transporter [Streptomyces sp. ISL-11]MBT2384327.1 heavy-metal-associated domain-containing protein [Streptomyces sp. ISL-11]
MSDCCTPEGSCHTSRPIAVADGTVVVYAVSGMTCGHCKSTLTRAIGELDTVLGVEVDLSAGTVAVTFAGEPDDTLIAEVVDDAGYELTGRV